MLGTTWGGGGLIAVGDNPIVMNIEEYEVIKTKLMHLIYTDRNENEIVELMNKSHLCRQMWIRNDSPTANMILEEFPRFLDTPLLVKKKSHLLLDIFWRGFCSFNFYII